MGELDRIYYSGGNLKYTEFALGFRRLLRGSGGFMTQNGTSRRHFFIGSALLACGMFFVAAPLPAEDGRIYWINNYREALQEAKRTQKPIFLEFRCEA